MPAASSAAAPDTPALPHTFRPLAVRMVVIVLGVLLLVICVVTWLAFPADIKAQFDIVERLIVLAFGIALYVIGYALARSRVLADEHGVKVVNGYKMRRFHWNEVLAVSLRRGSPWAELDLSDGTSVPAMGIQASDGSRALGQVRQLRRLVETMTRPEV